MAKKQSTSADVIGAWVAFRCTKRTVAKSKGGHGKSMDQSVKDWVNWYKTLSDTQKKSAPAPPNVVEWVARTIEDPDWSGSLP